MKALTVLLSLGLASLASAQADGPLRAELTPVSKVAVSGGSAAVTLRVEVLEDTDIEATVLRGMHLTTTVDGKKAATLGKKISGKTRVAAGTTIQRTLDVQVPAVDSSTLATVTVTWPGLPNATTDLKVAPDPATIDLDAIDLAKTKVLLITNHGDMTLGFRPDKAPRHVRNFIELSRDGFYDGSKFHRILHNFMIQGGCPNTKEGASGTPGTGSRPDGETLAAEFNDTVHVKGTLSMARSTSPNSASCQFFICHGRAKHLDGQYTAFGKLEDGMDVLNRIAGVRVEMSGRERSKPVNPVHLHKAVVLPAK